MKKAKENARQCKKVFCNRGNGWVAGGLARLLSEMPKDHKTREFYLTQFKEVMERIATLQQQDGLWRSSLLDPDAFPGGEASGSGFDIYAMAWGVNNKVLSRDRFLPVIVKGWTGLNKLVYADGMIGWTQPIGLSRGEILRQKAGKFTAPEHTFWPDPRSQK